MTNHVITIGSTINIDSIFYVFVLPTNDMKL